MPLNSRPSTHTATFDIGLLQAVLSEAVEDAGLQVHLESSSSADDPESWVAWSQAVTAFVGRKSYPFQTDNPSGSGYGLTFTYLLKIDSSFPQIIVEAGPSITFIINFTPATMHVIDATADADSVTDQDIDIENLSISVTLTFDGTITPSCDVVLSNIDQVDKFQSKVTDSINQKLQEAGATPGLIRPKIDSFFRNLMRLGDNATIDPVNGYRTDGAGTTLTVMYSLPPIVPIPRPVIGPILAR